jgi:hypothetical protein
MRCDGHQLLPRLGLGSLGARRRRDAENAVKTIHPPSVSFMGTQVATDELIRSIVIAEEMRAVRMMVRATEDAMKKAKEAQAEYDRKQAERARRKRRWRIVETVTIGVVGIVLLALVACGAGPFGRMAK